jgi:hypothetical protein
MLQCTDVAPTGCFFSLQYNLVSQPQGNELYKKIEFKYNYNMDGLPSLSRYMFDTLIHSDNEKFQDIFGWQMNPSSFISFCTLI